jgi:tRNA(fMet)-specific endonuclease VapC
MSLHVLDTDTVTLLLRGHAGVASKAAVHDASELAVTIITVEEVLTGWYSQIRRAKKDDQLVRAYAALQEAVEFFGQVRLLPFDPEAIADFKVLRRLHRRTGTNDLRIAAIIRFHVGILVTCNQRDFKDISGLQLVDWS